MKTVAAIYPNFALAGRACRDLEHIGIPREDISLIAGNVEGKHDEYLARAKKASASTAEGAASGAALTGGLAMLATLATIAIPGVGPIVALGSLGTVMLGLGVGAGTGAVIGAFHQMGVPHDEAPLYEEAVKRGEIVVAAIVDEQFEQEAVAVLKQDGAGIVRDELDPWAETDWSGPKRDPHPYVSDSGKYES